jgi:hypothetical protein
MKDLSSSTFRSLIVFSAALSLCGPAMNALFLPQLPIEQSPLMFPAGAPVFHALAFANVLVALASTVGLYFYRRWARVANLATTAIGPGLYAMTSYFVTAGPKEATDTLSTLTGGAVLALAYFSPIAQRFESATSKLPSSANHSGH